LEFKEGKKDEAAAATVLRSPIPFFFIRVSFFPLTRFYYQFQRLGLQESSRASSVPTLSALGEEELRPGRRRKSMSIDLGQSWRKTSNSPWRDLTGAVEIQKNGP
jgi:hypothetical protein